MATRLRGCPWIFGEEVKTGVISSSKFRSGSETWSIFTWLSANNRPGSAPGRTSKAILFHRLDSFENWSHSFPVLPSPPADPRSCLLGGEIRGSSWTFGLNSNPFSFKLISTGDSRQHKSPIFERYTKRSSQTNQQRLFRHKKVSNWQLPFTSLTRTSFGSFTRPHCRPGPAQLILANCFSRICKPFSLSEMVQANGEPAISSPPYRMMIL